MKNSAEPVDLAPRRQFATIAHPDRGFDQRAGVEIEHRLGVGLIAGARIVAAQHQEVADAERRRADQIALQREAVAVAAGQLQDRLDAVLVQDRRSGERAEMRARAGPVGDVDGVGDVLERHRLDQQLLRVARDRRRDLGRDDEAAGRECPFELAAGGLCGRHCGPSVR